MSSAEEVVTHGSVDRRYRLCRCSDCGHESRCTPDNDFYTKADAPEGPLRCERCMRAGREIVDASPTKKQLTFLPSLGNTIGVGWMRDDGTELFHMFANVLPGERFRARNAEGGPHWPCSVCETHSYTEADFYEQVTALIQALAEMKT